jgi:hypothetical protein
MKSLETYAFGATMAGVPLLVAGYGIWCLFTKTGPDGKPAKPGLRVVGAFLALNFLGLALYVGYFFVALSPK